jgi:hypothetical protein
MADIPAHLRAAHGFGTWTQEMYQADYPDMSHDRIHTIDHLTYWSFEFEHDHRDGG